MRRKVSYLAWFVICLAATALLAQKPADSLTGTWTGDWGPTPTHRNPVIVELKWDGKSLAGTVNPGANAVTLQKTSFNPNTGAIHLEADATGPDGKVHFIIDGKAEKGTMIGSWNHGDRKGDFKIARK